MLSPPSIADLDGDDNLVIILNIGGIPNVGRYYLMDSSTLNLSEGSLNTENHSKMNTTAAA